VIILQKRCAEREFLHYQFLTPLNGTASPHVLREDYHTLNDLEMAISDRFELV
jgi:hypothetical protein